MRKYVDEAKKELLEIYCNKCGKKVTVNNGIVKEGVFSITYGWGFFSGKDGESHSFDLCETCYDKWIAAFQIPVERNLENELL